MPETFTRVKHIPHVPETVVVSLVWVVGLADTVVVGLDRDGYIREEAVALIGLFMLPLFVLATDEVVGILYVSSPLPPSKIQSIDS